MMMVSIMVLAVEPVRNGYKYTPKILSRANTMITLTFHEVEKTVEETELVVEIRSSFVTH